MLFIIAITSMLQACLEEESLNLKYEGFLPMSALDSWQISDPETEGMDPRIIDQLYWEFYNEDLYPNIQSLLIVKNGKLVAEAYCKKEHPWDQLHNVMSVTKSVTSLLAGIAFDQGLLNSLDSSVYGYLPEYFDDDLRKRDITIRHVLTMETGLNFDDEVHTSQMRNYKGNSLDYVLNKDLVFLPGTDWYYGDGNPQLISGIIQKVSGKTTSAFAEEFLLQPLRIENYRWESHADGLTYGAVSLWLTPRDMARIGLLVANRGIWEGQRIVSAEWINESTQIQSEFQDYGYYWHILPNLGFQASGHGGQIIWVFPGKNLVVVITSDPYAKTYVLSADYNYFYDMILQSMHP